mmetsp:Transcript_2456/g.5280  ORF Transcript_2456/g.5280 Transcript_2456/m.5280 type:complete len:84 (-) Transcript_2456:1104-1355(-)
MSGELPSISNIFYAHNTILITNIKIPLSCSQFWENHTEFRSKLLHKPTALQNISSTLLLAIPHISYLLGCNRVGQRQRIFPFN